MERSEYIEQRNGGFYVAGTRVSLDSIVYSFKAGDSRKPFARTSLPSALEQVYGAIAFYLAHEQEVDANIREGEAEIGRSVPPLSESRPELYARLERARHESGVSGPGETLSILFQADNDLKRIIVDATLRREPRIDFQTAQAARLDDLDDEAVLSLAASQSRILVSHDKRTMPNGLASFVASGGTSPGVLLVIPKTRQSAK